jgi:hypothetical protein
VKKLALGIVAVAAAWAAVCGVRRPSNDRDWALDQQRLPIARIDGPIVTIDNVRNFTYRSESDYVPRWERRSYDLRRLDSVWFGVERFGQPGIAHTFLSFGFGSEYLAVSAEIRKEKGEIYSPLRGLLDQYEITYVLGDERDVIGLRTNFRKDEVFLYPVNATREKMQRAFLDVLHRVNGLARKPEFYNTLTNTCTTSIVRHVNSVTPRRIPFSMRVVLPAWSDRLAHELKLIGGHESFEQLQARHRIDGIAQRYGIGADFSRVIRRGYHHRDTESTENLCVLCVSVVDYFFAGKACVNRRPRAIQARKAFAVRTPAAET